MFDMLQLIVLVGAKDEYSFACYSKFSNKQSLS